MAMSPDELRKRAAAQAKRITAEHGENAYGGVKFVNSHQEWKRAVQEKQTKPAVQAVRPQGAGRAAVSAARAAANQATYAGRKRTSAVERPTVSVAALPQGVEALLETQRFVEERRRADQARREAEDGKLSGAEAREAVGGVLERIGNTLTGAGKQYAGSIVNVGGWLAGQSRATDDEALASLQRAAEAQRRRAEDPGLTEAQRAQNAAMAERTGRILEGRTNSRAAAGALETRLTGTADRLAQSGAADLEEAKDGLNAAGRFLVDVGAGAAQLGGDILLGLATGGGALVPMALRGFGGGTQEARLAGADTQKQGLYGAASAAVSVLTEKISNVAAPLARAFGRGVADDAIETGVRKALDSLAKTDAGRAGLQRLGTVLLSAGGEGAEELLEGAVQPILQRLTYDPNAEWDWSDIARQGLIGAAIGGAMGGLGGSPGEAEWTNTPAVSEAVQAQKTAPTEGAESTPVIADYQRQERHGDILDTVREYLPDLENMPSVHALTGNEFQRSSGDNRSLRAKVIDFFNSIGNRITRPGFGDIELNTAGARDSLAHGYGKLKASAFAALPSILTDGRLISSRGPYPGHNYNSYIFAAPVDVGEERCYVGALVIQDDKTQRYKLHEVLATNKSGVSLFQSESDNTAAGPLRNDTPPGEPLGSPSSDTTIPQREGGVKTEYAREGGKNTIPAEIEALLATANRGRETPEGLGAASAGFDPYSHWQNQTGDFHPAGENPARLVELPKTDPQGRATSATARTAMEAEITPEAMLPGIEAAAAAGDFSYNRITNRKTLAKAEAEIRDAGFHQAYANWRTALGKRADAKTTVMGWSLYNAAANAGDTGLALDILQDITASTRAAAQALQAQRLVKRMSPQGQLYAAQRTVQNLQRALAEKYGDEAPSLTLDPALAEKFLAAADQEARDAALHDIYKDVGRQIPATWQDKWNAWRYLAMLGNPRTHIRNIVGNAGFVPVRMAKDAIAANLERIFMGETGADSGRTKAALNLTSAEDRALLQFAKEDFAKVKDVAMGEGKFEGGVNANKAIREGQRIFGKPLSESKSPLNLLANGLEAARRFSNDALDAEYRIFSKTTYAGALASFLKARGVTAEMLQDGGDHTRLAALLEEGRAYAIREAQRATYRDRNAFSDMISSIGFRTPDTTAKRAMNTMVEGVLPFKRTPANILVRGMEYSPAGLVKGLTADLHKVRRGEMELAQALDNIAAGLTGSGLMALGGLLRAAGVITGGGDDDDKQANQDDLTGHQDYALELGDWSITLDWLAPEALPFFVGVELCDNFQEGQKSIGDVIEAMGSSVEPMLEMSMLQSLNELFESARYSQENAMFRTIVTAATSYFTQAIPTLSGQLARTLDGTRRTNATDPNSEIPKEIQYLLQQTTGKIPGLESQKEPYIDAWGREETSENPAMRIINNFLNPAYVSRIQETAVDRELQRLYDAGYDRVLPGKDGKTFSAGGEEIAMTPEEYTAYSKRSGQTKYAVLEGMMQTADWGAMTDAERAKATEDVYGYARDLARAEIAQGRGIDYQTEARTQELLAAEEVGIDAASWYAAKFRHDAIDKEDLNVNQKTTHFAAWLDEGDHSVGQKALLRDQMMFWQRTPGNADRYDELTTAARLENDLAAKVTDAMTWAEKVNGDADLSQADKYNVVFRLLDDLPPAQQYDALAVYETAGSGDKSKLRTAEKYGVAPSVYVDILLEVAEARDKKVAAGGTNSTTKADLIQVLNGAGLSQEQKRVLWPILSTANNPYGGQSYKHLDWVYVP